jgi:O-methyltransferase
MAIVKKMVRRLLICLGIRRLVHFFLKKMHYVLCADMVYIGRERIGNIRGDYIRLSSLELIAHEIYEKGIQGCAAELGVYQGDFEQHINSYFFDRKLYLFDTFEGFDERDIKIDVKEKYSTGEQDFSKTSIELVLKKMKYRENCIIRKGYFPETAKGIEEKFAFVSIDADLFEPIYQGLCYFYQRLEKGGYIFVHDYNNTGYTGAKVAVEKFSQEYNAPYFPLSDICGSAIFSK